MSSEESPKSLPPDTENFLRDYLDLNNGTEIPPRFALWCGISGMSCVLGRRLFLDMGTYTIYPNMFIVLVAGAGHCRKSTAIGMIEKLLIQIEPRPNLVAQKITPEGLIDAVKVEIPEPDKLRPHNMRTCSEGFALVDEMVTFLNINSYEAGMGSLLTTLWDCKESFEYRTKGRGRELITRSCFGMLGGTTVELLRDAIPEEAIGGGLTSRIIFVYVDTPMPPVAITNFSVEKRRVQERLVRTLQRMSSLEGEVSMSSDAWEFYEAEYNRFYKNPMFELKTLAGYASRRHIHMIKTAMIFAASKTITQKVIINKSDLEGACALLEQDEKCMPRVLSLITMNQKGGLMEMVYQMIKQKDNGIPRSMLMAQMSHKIDSRELNEILETLVQAQRIKATAHGNNILYRRIS